MFTPSDCKDRGIRKLKFQANYQFLSSNYLILSPRFVLFMSLFPYSEYLHKKLIFALNPSPPPPRALAAVSEAATGYG